VFSVKPAWAAVDEWDAGGPDANFATHLNWTDNTRPGSENTAQFSNGVYEVWFDQTTVATYNADPQISGLVVSAANVSFINQEPAPIALRLDGNGGGQAFQIINGKANFIGLDLVVPNRVLLTDSVLEVDQGATISINTDLLLGASGDTSQLSVFGPTSAVVINSTDPEAYTAIGGGGGSGLVVIGDGGAFTSNQAILIGGEIGGAGTHGNLQVNSGGQLTVPQITFSLAGDASVTSELWVDGQGSVATVESNLSLGFGGNDSIHLFAGGSLEVGPGGSTEFGFSGVIDIDGGSASLGTLNWQGGQINLISGSLSYVGDLDTSLGPIGANPTLVSGQNVTLSGVTDVVPVSTLTLNGGTLATGSLVVDGTVNFQLGTLQITGPGGLTLGAAGQFNWTTGVIQFSAANSTFKAELLGADNSLDPGQTISTAGNGQTVTLVDAFTVSGGTIRPNDLVNQSMLAISSGSARAINSATNSGYVLLSNALATFGGSTVNNTGTIRGAGRLAGVVNNASTGQIEVVSSERMVLDGSLSNQGHVSVIGGELQVEGTVFNFGSGLISAREAILRFDAGVSNGAGIVFSNGTVDVYGDIVQLDDQMLGKGRITVSGGGIVNFYDDVTINAGANNVQATALGSTISKVVFFGDYNGGATGGGQAFIEGDHRPGNSQAIVTFQGDASYGPFSTLHIEIAGATPGTEFDKVVVTGDLA
jgi:hypothetical protein